MSASGRSPAARSPVDLVLAIGLPVVAILVLLLFVGSAVWAASNQGTLGFDFLSYDSAVRRFLAGGVLYDQSYQFTGSFGLFYYPPPFVLLAIPLTLFSPSAAADAFTAILLVAFVAGVAILPVSARVRWATILLGGMSWPLVYAIKLGQVGPILLLLFAIGWRWMDRPWRIGTATAIGIAIKLQPALIVGWAILTRRLAVVWVTLVVFLALAVVATIVAGPTSWPDQLTLLARVSKPILTPHNFTPGRLAYEAGLSEAAAWAVQIANWALVAVVVVYAIFRATAVASYLSVVIASQLISPILWDHYALMLLLPVAWLISKGWWWTAAVPLWTSVLLVGSAVTPTWAYPIGFWIILLAVVWVGREERRALEGASAIRSSTAPTATAVA